MFEIILFLFLCYFTYMIFFTQRTEKVLDDVNKTVIDLSNEFKDILSELKGLK